MSKEKIENAIKDVEYIKNVIINTSISLKKLSTSFIQLGMYLLVMIAIIATYNAPMVGVYSIPGDSAYRLWIEILGKHISIDNQTTLNIIISIFNLIIFALLILVIIRMSKIIKKNSLTGLSKQLIILWIYIIIFNMICIMFLPYIMQRFTLSINPRFYSTPPPPINTGYDIYIITICNLFTLSIGLLMLTIFTNLRLPKLMFIVYAIACLCLMVFPLSANYYCMFITPVTVIILGIYLKLIDAR